MLKQIEAGVLRVAYEESGAADGTPVFLLHGFPYDVHAYDEVTPLLVEAGCRVIAPYLRGYGPTRFLSPDTLRSGQQAVLAHDLLAFMDALKIQSSVLAGYDWGGRAACIVAALWPERVIGLVSGGGYNIQHVPSANKPEPPEREHKLWYNYYFHSERGRAGLQQHRYELCRLLWHLWSPTWSFSEAVYQRTAESFNNLDFVDVVIHSYRVRFGLVPGDPSVASTEEQLTRRPPIAVPTIVLHGQDNGLLTAVSSEAHRQFFTSDYERRVIPMAGHNVPQEAPRDFSAAVLSIINRAKEEHRVA
jgi:pimeloyl-ACP methyl ester carboxylesterase